MYCRANVFGPSYHNIFLLTFVSGSLLIYQVIQDKQQKLFSIKSALLSILAGFLMGMAVLTIPVLAAFYIIISTVLLGVMIHSKSLQGKYQLPVIFFWSGTLIMGGIYLLFLFSRVTAAELIQNIPYLFQDSVHASRTIGEHLYDFLWLCGFYAKYTLIALLLAVIYRIGCLILKKQERKFSVIFLLIGLMAFCIDLYQKADSHMSSYISLLFCTLIFIVLYGDFKPEKRKANEGLFFIIGAASVCTMYSFASATSDPIIQGMIFVTIGLQIVISDSQKNWNTKISVKGILIAVILIMIGMTMRIRVVSVYRDAPLQELTTKITKGPGKGLITTDKNVENYNNCLNVMNEINSLERDENDTILITAMAPWLYTATDIPCGAHTTWRVLLDNPLLKEYFKNHSISDLKYILVLDEEYGAYKGAMTPEGSSKTPNQNQYEGFLWEIINSNEYQSKKVSSGILYNRND